MTGHISNVFIREYKHLKYIFNLIVVNGLKIKLGTQLTDNGSLLCPCPNHSAIFLTTFPTTFWGIHKMSIAGKGFNIAFLKFNWVEIFSQLQIDALYKIFCQDIADLKKL